MHISVEQCSLGRISCVCLDGTEAALYSTLQTIASQRCNVTVDVADAIQTLVQNLLASGSLSSTGLVALSRLQYLTASNIQILSNFPSSIIVPLISHLLSNIDQLSQNFLSNLISSDDGTLRPAVATLMRAAELYLLAFSQTRAFNTGATSIFDTIAVQSLVASIVRLRSASLPDRSLLTFPRYSDPQIGAFSSQSAGDSLTLDASALSALFTGNATTGSISISSILFDSLASYLPTTVDSAGMNGQQVQINSQAISAVVFPAVQQQSSAFVEVTLALRSPLNNTNQSVYCCSYQFSNEYL